TLRVSADPVHQATAHSRAESRASRPSTAAPGERRTLRWREQDSNLYGAFPVKCRFRLAPVLCSERESRSSSRRLRSGSRSARKGSRDRNGSKARRLAASLVFRSALMSTRRDDEQRYWLLFESFGV